MSVSAAVVEALGSPEFQNDLYGTVSMTARLAAAIKNRANVMRLSMHLRGVNKDINSLLGKVDDILAGRLTVKAEEEATPQKLQETADNVDYLVRVLEYQFEAMRRAGLTNNSLTAGVLRTFHSNLDPLKDLADWIDLLAKPQEMESVLARAQAEIQRGEIYELRRVE